MQTATRTAFVRIVDTCLAEGASALLIAGDLFDGAQRSARTAAFLVEQLDRLRKAGIRVFYIRGNHDAENPVAGETALPDNVHTFDARGGKVQLAEDVWIHGVSFSGRHVPDSLLPRFDAPVPGAVNIAMLHTSLAGAEGHDVYAPCSVADLSAMGFDYWALGHVHRRQVHGAAPWIVMPGTPQGRDMGETGPKSATMLTLGPGGIGVEEIPTSAVEFVRHEMNVPQDGDDADLRADLRGALLKAVQGLVSDTGVVRLTLKAPGPRHWQILRDRDLWTETLHRLAADTGRLWLDRLDIVAAGAEPAGQGATDELARLMAQIRAEPGFAETCRLALEDLAAELPADRRRALLPDEDAAAALARALAEAGAEAMIARMKGAPD